MDEKADEKVEAANASCPLLAPKPMKLKAFRRFSCPLLVPKPVKLKTFRRLCVPTSGAEDPEIGDPSQEMEPLQVVAVKLAAAQLKQAAAQPEQIKTEIHLIPGLKRYETASFRSIQHAQR